MIVATHQPIFLPWPGFFYKVTHSDRLVLLDDVQFPRGRSWLTRNRVKNEDGELLLTVPVLKKGRGLQTIRRVEIFNEIGWRNKHLRSIQQNYLHAPYFADYFTNIETIYQKSHSLLAEFTIEMIRFFTDALSLQTNVLCQSEMGVVGKGTALLIEICEHLGADRLLAFPVTEKYIDMDAMKKHGIKVIHANYRPPVYPQLWGNFIFNLSTLDLLMNCGPKSREILMGEGRPCPPNGSSKTHILRAK